MPFEFVERENARGVIAGSDFGSSVRVVMRSPSSVLITGVGAQIWNRKNTGSMHDFKKLFWDRATKEKFAACRETIDEFFGAGATDALLQSWGKARTVLVDGGGERLNRPINEAREEAYADYATWTITQRFPLTNIPCCKQCEKELHPRTIVHHMGHKLLPDHPRTVEECQRLTNYPVVAVFDYGINRRNMAGYVERFETWDGVSVFDPHFCSDRCAAIYGRRAAEVIEPPLPPNVVPEKTRWTHESHQHYPDESTEHVMPDGTTIRL